MEERNNAKLITKAAKFGCGHKICNEINGRRKLVKPTKRKLLLHPNMLTDEKDA